MFYVSSFFYSFAFSWVEMRVFFYRVLDCFIVHIFFICAVSISTRSYRNNPVTFHASVRHPGKWYAHDNKNNHIFHSSSHFPITVPNTLNSSRIGGCCGFNGFNQVRPASITSTLNVTSSLPASLAMMRAPFGGDF